MSINSRWPIGYFLTGVLFAIVLTACGGSGGSGGGVPSSSVSPTISISVSDGIAPPVALAAFDLRVAEGFHKALYADPGVSSIAGSVSIRSASAPMIIPPGLPTDRRLPWINL
jgi:hypothetical protein